MPENTQVYSKNQVQSKHISFIHRSENTFLGHRFLWMDSTTIITKEYISHFDSETVRTGGGGVAGS